MALHVLFVLAQVRLAQIDLIVELQSAVFIRCPNGAARGRQCRHNTIEELAVELGSADILPRQLRDLSHQTANLLLGLLDQFGIDNLLGTHKRGAQPPTN